MRGIIARLLLGGLLVSASAACSSKKTVANHADHSAEELQGHECATCGMTTSGQPAPRGQLVHRDNTREFFCSLSDMLTYLDAPSPHGDAVAVFVESMDQVPDPLLLDKSPRPWIDATRGSYVVGFEKMVMGEPILAYSTAAEAQAQAKRLSAQVLTWTELRGWAAQRRQQ